MSTIWTPGGERPVGQPTAGPDEFDPDEPVEPSGGSPGGGASPGEPSDEELAEVQRQLAETPASVVVANHALGLFHLAALHLSQDPPHFADAQLAIDGMAALVEGLAGRLDEDEAPLTEALAQVRLAFVQIKASRGGG